MTGRYEIHTRNDVTGKKIDCCRLRCHGRYLSEHIPYPHETVGKYNKNNFVFITVTPAPVQMTRKKGGFIQSVLNTVTPAPVQMTRKKVGLYRLSFTQ